MLVDIFKIFTEDDLKKVFKGKMPMLYYPYAFNTNVVKVIEKENIKDKFKNICPNRH